jgi:hypothetical protein
MRGPNDAMLKCLVCLHHQHRSTYPRVVTAGAKTRLGIWARRLAIFWVRDIQYEYFEWSKLDSDIAHLCRMIKWSLRWRNAVAHGDTIWTLQRTSVDSGIAQWRPEQTTVRKTPFLACRNLPRFPQIELTNSFIYLQFIFQIVYLTCRLVPILYVVFLVSF